MNYSLEFLPPFRVLVHCREFHPDGAMAGIPAFWDDYCRAGYGRIACGQVGICFPQPGRETFLYGIGNACTEEHTPEGTVLHVAGCPDLRDVPDGFTLRTIPAHTWLTVETRGALPNAIQDAYPLIAREWPPGLERLAAPEIEEYGPCETPEDARKPDYRCTIRIPVRLTAEDRFSVRFNVLTAVQFEELGRSVGWEMPPLPQCERALRNSLVTFSLYREDTLAGMARLIGDRSMAYMLREVVIRPAFQKQGAGTFLLNAVQQWIARDVPDGFRASCELFAADGQTGFYRRNGFTALPHSGNENGMSRMITGILRTPDAD